MHFYHVTANQEQWGQMALVVNKINKLTKEAAIKQKEGKACFVGTE
ncbi:MAG: hypothetical protein ACK5JF_01420 [Oscillospiraceae bacterium]